MVTDQADDKPHKDDTNNNHTLPKDQYKNSTDAELALDTGRRSFLKLSGLASTGLLGTGLMGSVSAETRQGISFDTVVDAVEDLDVDNTGQEAIDSALDTALQSDTLIEFPPGRYRIEQRHSLQGLDRVGLSGTGDSRRDVQFIPPKGRHVRMFDGGRSGSGAVLIENLCFHDRSDDTSITSINIRTTGGSVIRNIEWLGRTPSAEQNTGIHYQFGAQVMSQSGVMLVEDVYAGLDEPSVPVDYPDGVSFFYAGPAHKGETILRNPTIHERNSNATRATNISGVLTIEGGEFVNNQNSNIRFSAGDHPSKVSSATGSYIKIDGSRDASEAIRVDASSNGYAGSIYRDITIDWTKKNTRGVIAAPSFSGHGRAEFYNCVVRNDGDPDRAPTVAAGSVSETSDDAIIIENCSFTGSGGGFSSSRSGSVIRDSCIDMPNASINGFETKNIGSSGCETPGSEDSDAADSDQDSGSDLPNTITVRGTGTATKFTFTVSDTVEAINYTDESHDSIIDGERVEAWVTTSSHVDEFAYSGEITEFGYLEGGPAAITRNDEPVSADDFGAQNEGPEASISVTEVTGLSVELSAADSSDPDGEITGHQWAIDGTAHTGETITHTFDAPGTYQVTLTVEDDDGATTEVTDEMTVDYGNTLEIHGTGEPTNYYFIVSEALNPVEQSIEEWDDVSETGADGWVTNSQHVDKFTFAGEISEFSFTRGTAAVYVNGTQIEPAAATTTPRELKIQGTGTATEYAFEIDGSLDSVEESIEDWDEVMASGATGWVTSPEHLDEFVIEGEITAFEFLQGKADVYLDGEKVDPTTD